MALTEQQIRGKAMRGALEEFLGVLASANVERARKRKKKPEREEHLDRTADEPADDVEEE